MSSNMANLTNFYIVNIPYSVQNLCCRGSSLYRKSTVYIWPKLLENIREEEPQKGRTLFLSSGYAKKKLIKQKKNKI